MNGSSSPNVSEIPGSFQNFEKVPKMSLPSVTFTYTGAVRNRKLHRVQSETSIKVASGPINRKAPCTIKRPENLIHSRIRVSQDNALLFRPNYCPLLVHLCLPLLLHVNTPLTWCNIDTQGNLCILFFFASANWVSLSTKFIEPCKNMQNMHRYSVLQCAEGFTKKRQCDCKIFMLFHEKKKKKIWTF